MGQNGSGKTTIIECLKYGTAGMLPPGGNKDGAFIHDPKLCRDNPVKAQVKLQFKPTTDSDGKMLATRSMELVVNRTKRKQRRVEGNLVQVKKGERITVSKTAAELDRYVPQYMGVSRAILDNVIFCHQDECLWPLSAPSVLKKKFDEIFEAQKYTKAIDNIKGIRRHQSEELGKFKIVEQHEKENKTKADKCKRKSGELHGEIETLREEIKNLHGTAEDARDKAQEAWNHVARFEQVVHELKAAHKNKEWCQNQLQSLKTVLKERKEPDDALEAELAQFDERMKTQQTRMEQQRDKYGDIEKGIVRVRNNQSEKRTEVGKHEHAKATHEKRIKDREQAIKQSAREHRIHGFDMDLDDAQINKFMERITKLSKDQTSKIEKLRRDNTNEAQKIQEVLENLREHGTSLREGRRAAKDQITNNDRRIVLYHSELGKIATDEAGKARLEANIEELETRLRKVRQQDSASGTESKIEEVSKNLQALETEAASLNDELIQGTKRAEDLAGLRHLQKESKDRQRSIGTMKRAHNKRLKELIGNDWEPDIIEDTFYSVLEAKKKEVAEAERQRDGVSRELGQLEFKLGTARKNSKKKEEELEECANELKEATDGDPEDYPEALEEAQGNRDIRNADVNNYSNMRKYFNDAIETARSNQPACRLCTRAFHDQKAIRSFISRLEKQVSKGALDQMRKELEGYEEELKKVKEAGTSYDTWVRLSEKEIPQLREEVSELEQQRENLLREVEQHDTVVAELEDSLRNADTLTKPVATIAKCQADYKEYEAQISEVKSKQKDAGSIRKLDDINKQIQANIVEQKGLRSKMAQMQSEDRQRREEISSLGLELGGVKSKLMNADHELEKKSTIEKQITELRESSQEKRSAMENLDSRIEELEPKLAEQRTKLDDLRQRGQAQENKLQQEATSLNDSVRALMQADHEIRSYVQSGSSSKLDQCRHDIQTFDKEIGSLETEQRQVTVEINGIREELHNQEETKRVIDDNLKYRKTQRDLQSIDQEIAELTAQNAARDQAQFRAEAERWQRAHELAATAKTGKMGTMKAKDDQLGQLLHDWNTEYKDAAAKYKRAHIEVETTKAAVEDLARYGSALDSAIMSYHSLKMEEINRLLQELWQKTYQGSDVDGIRIRSESERATASGGASATATTTGRRSYNYRVVMVKQDAEMDMRGRCSAGQKVLASILIRLALAECFGQNCGLIALDEPTTNLDRDNVQALAQSLHGLIKDRMAQSNFQLVVITHDEDFLRYMRCQDFCDHYWRVSRNDRQKSVIEKQSVAAVLYNY